MMSLIYQSVRLFLAVLYPVYMSFKAVRNRDVKKYVQWMIYWIVFSSFTFLEAFADVTIFWIPFYSEIKTLFLCWLVIPSMRGSSVVFRKLLYPELIKKEKVIDEQMGRIKDRGYQAMIALGARGFTFATSVVLSAAVKGQTTLANKLQRSYSLNDLSDNVDVPDALLEQSSDSNDIVEDVEEEILLKTNAKRDLVTSRTHNNQLSSLIRRFDQRVTTRNNLSSAASASVNTTPVHHRLNKYNFK